MRHLFIAFLVLSCCARPDLAPGFALVRTGDDKATVTRKMGRGPDAVEMVELLGLSYERLRYTDSRSSYVIVLTAGMTTAKFAEPVSNR